MTQGERVFPCREQKIAKTIFSFLMMVVFCLVLSPLVYNQTEDMSVFGYDTGQSRLVQNHFRIYKDDGGLNSANSLAQEDQNLDIVVDLEGASLRVRIEVANTGNAGAGISSRYLEFKEDSGVWTKITGNSNNVRLTDSSYFSDGDATTSRLTPMETFVSGKGKDLNSDTGGAGLIISAYIEDEYSLKFQSGAAGHSYQFRVTNGDLTFDAYDAIPIIRAISPTCNVSDAALMGHSWGENIGWVNFGTTKGSARITDSALSGYVWGENIGWISLNCSNDNSCLNFDYKVSNNRQGVLSGYAWSSNTGRINFKPTNGGVVINSAGEFLGYAWGENIGWIVFNCANNNSCNRVSYKVKSDWCPKDKSTATIMVDKKTIGGDGAFSFKATGGQSYSDFTIATKDGLGSNVQTNVAPGTYSVQEITPSGWTKTEDTCGTITVIAGQTATCSITNANNELGLSIESISPESALLGGPGLTLTIFGTGFVPSSVAKFEGSNRGTAFISGSRLKATIRASDLAKEGAFDITVTNPLPDGRTSNAVPFNVYKEILPCKNPPCEEPVCKNPPCDEPVCKNPPCDEPVCENPPCDKPSDKEPPDNEPPGEKPPAEWPPVIGVIGGYIEKIADAVIPIQEVKVAAEYVKKTIETPVGSTIAKILTAMGAAMSVASIFSSPVSWWGLLLSFLGIRKKNLPWGVVYDSVTKRPLDPAYVTLKKIDGKEIDTGITDIDGRYGFLVEPGEYAMSARKTNYVFPSKKIIGDHDGIYDNLYYGEKLEITKEAEVITKNIPLDSLKFDWNEFAKKSKNYMKFYSKWDVIIRRIADPFFIVGFVISAIILFLAPSPYNIIIFTMYIVLSALKILMKVLGIKPNAIGYIIDKENGVPLSFAILKIVSPLFDKEIGFKVADQFGRYYCLVPKGKYYVKIEKKNDDGSYSLVHTSSLVNALRSGIIKKRFKV